MNGIVDEKLRKRAQDAGVQVFTPREFCQGKLDETEEISAFLQRFREQAVRYLEARQRELGPDKGYEVISLMDGYYRHILRGETEGRTSPVRLSVVTP